MKSKLIAALLLLSTTLAGAAYITPGAITGALGYTPESTTNKDTDANLAADSDTKYPSQKAIKAYVDANIGGFTLPALTAGSVLFSDGATIAQDNANFFWDDATDRLFMGSNASIAGSNAGVQYSNASTANRAQIKLHSYINAASIAGVSTLTSKSGTVGVNNSIGVSQDYSKWTAQAGATTVGSAPISGTWAFKSAATINALTVPTDFHISTTNLAGTLGDKLYLTSEGALKLPGYGLGFAKFDASGNVTSAFPTATEVGLGNVTNTAQWNLAGNAGTGGTATLGTTDNQDFAIITNGSTQVTYKKEGGWGSTQNIVPVDATNHFQDRHQVNLNPSVATTTANHIQSSKSVSYDGGNTGFGFDGSILINQNSFGHTGTGTVGYVGVLDNSAIFSSVAGKTTLFKGNNLDAQVGAGYEVTSFNGTNSSLNANGSIFGNASLWNSNGTLLNTNATSVNNGLHSLAIQGTSVITGNATGNDVQVSLQGAATANQMIGSSIGITDSGTSSTNGITGDQISIQVQNTATATNITAVNAGITVQDTAVVTSITGIDTTPAMSGGSTATSNFNGATVSPSMFDSSTAQNLSGLNVSPNMHGTSTVTGAQPFNVNMSLQDTAVVTNAFTVANIYASSTVAQADGTTGLNVSIDNVIVPDALSKNVLTLFGGKIQSDSTFTIPPADTFFQQLYSGSNATVAAAAPISTLMLGANINPNTSFNDDWTADFTGLRIGLAAVSVIPTIVGAAGKTMDSYEAFIGAFNNTSGSGTLDQAFMFRAMGGLPAGGTLLVNNMTAFGAASPLCALAGNCWGVKIEDTAANNAFAKNVIVGATTPTNASVGLEVSATDKAILFPRMTTAQRVALTGINGMQVYDTTLGTFQCFASGVWASCGSGSAATVFQEAPTGTPNDVLVAFTLPNVPTVAASVVLSLDGLVLRQTVDYTIAGAAITMTVAPATGQTLWAIYH